VLVVDDARTSASTFRISERRSFEVTTLADPFDGGGTDQGQCFTWSSRLMMPKIPGLDLLAQIRAVDDDMR